MEWIRLIRTQFNKSPGTRPTQRPQPATEAPRETEPPGPVEPRFRYYIGGDTSVRHYHFIRTT